MIVVVMMYEEMYQWVGEDEELGQDVEDVDVVFVGDKFQGDYGEGDEDSLVIVILG